MPMTEAEILAECNSARDDAEFAAEEIRFFRLIGLGSGHVGAAWFRPHTDIEPGNRMFPGDRAQLAEANTVDNRGLHRIAIPAEPDARALFAALVRHELEHARQWDAKPGIFDLQDFIENDILPEIAGGLDGCGGWLINTIPSEMDCNAAASVYIADRFSADEIQTIRDGPQKYLACSLIPPLPPDTLPARMVAFAYVQRAAMVRHSERRGFPVSSILRSVYPPSVRIWEQLEASV